MPIEPLYNDPHSLKPIDKQVPERDYSETINIKGIELDVRINTPSSGWNRFFFYKGDQVVAVFSGMEISNDRI
ncbi:MAG TPA: hypothetical protein PKU78_06455, partial [Candidatus Dojkabacteria bacterium]|nr:hypothetical protein [Candidatus Dojkabacteria bacterium]